MQVIYRCVHFDGKFLSTCPSSTYVFCLTLTFCLYLSLTISFCLSIVWRPLTFTRSLFLVLFLLKKNVLYIYIYIYIYIYMCVCVCVYIMFVSVSKMCFLRPLKEIIGKCFILAYSGLASKQLPSSIIATPIISLIKRPAEVTGDIL